MNRREKCGRVLFLAPLTPRAAGVAEVSRSLLDSDLSNYFDIETINLKRSGGERDKQFTVGPASFAFAVHLWVRLVIRLMVFRPDVVYVASSYDWSYLRNVVLMFTAKLFDARVVCHFHGRRSGRLFSDPGALLLYFLRLTSRSFDRIIFLSEGLKTSLISIFGSSKAEVVPNFVEPCNYRLSAGLTASEPRLILIGRLSEDKGIYELLRATSVLRQEARQFRIDLLGVGETEEGERAVMAFAAQAAVEDVTCFHGVKTGQEKAELLAQAAVFVLPSKVEIFPIAVLEAFATGLPVVCTRIGALPEIVQDGKNGFLVEPGDVEALADRLRRLLDDAPLRQRMSVANQEAAAALYNKDRAVYRMREIFRKLC